MTAYITTTDKLFKNLHAEGDANPATKEALRYRRSLMEGYQLLDEYPLYTRTAETICSIIKNQDIRVRKVPSTILTNAMTGNTIYTLPEGEATIRGLLAGWGKFMHEKKELDPLIRMPPVTTSLRPSTRSQTATAELDACSTACFFSRKDYYPFRSST